MKKPPTNRLNRRAALVAALLSLHAVGNCGTAGKEFRTIAGPAVQQGVSSIVNGLLDGVFAVVAPDAGTNAQGTP